jgi:hypothetical protein
MPAILRKARRFEHLHDRNIPRPEHDKHVIHMNEVRCFASGWVQGAPASVTSQDRRVRPPDRLNLAIVQEETTMLKTISAALLAVSMLAVPAMAGSTKNFGKTQPAPVIKSVQVKPSVLNANAKMGRHHHRHGHHHHRHHGHR